MFLNSLKFINNTENSVTFAYIYHETFMNFIKIYEEELQYLLSDLNTESTFYKSSTLFD